MNVFSKSSNPAFNDRVFSDVYVTNPHYLMTISGTVNKTILAVTLTILGGVYAWYSPNSSAWILPTSIGGLILAIITVFKKDISPYTVPIYAILKGVSLGGLSIIIENKIGYNIDSHGNIMQTYFSGITAQTIAFTFGLFFIMLFLYKFKIIKVTNKFRSIVISSTLAIFTVYLVSWISTLFGVKPFPFLHESSMISILISFFVVIIASLNLMLDFDLIEQGVQQGAPKYMEWYSAFGILVTLVWLYIEILRLLSKLQRR